MLSPSIIFKRTPPAISSIPSKHLHLFIEIHLHSPKYKNYLPFLQYLMNNRSNPHLLNNNHPSNPQKRSMLFQLGIGKYEQKAMLYLRV